MPKKKLIVAQTLGLILFGLLHGNATASDQGHDSPDAGGHESHSFHKNTAGVFAGITHAGRRKNGPAIGFEYARRFNESFSLGAVAEYTGGDGDFWVAVLPFGWHLGHWKLYAAPGIEDGHHGTEELLRLGVERAFALSDGWEIAPQVNVDLVDGEDVWVFGVLFAKGF